MSKANTLNVESIIQLLHTYPDQNFIYILITITKFGAQIGYNGSRCHIQQPNHSSATIYADIITESIQLEFDKGRIKQISTLLNYYFYSPIGIIPKKINGIQTGWHSIFDLSSPTGISVNDGITKDHGTISYKYLDVAKQLVAEAGRRAILIKRDLKSAFHHIPISSLNYWLLIFL